MFKIYLNPGHSDKDPGAVGYETERKLNVKVTNYQKEHLLANYECEVKVTDGSINKTREAAAEANAWGANFVCSNHNNAGKGDGYEGLVHDESRVEMGKVFEKHVKAAGQNSRGIKLRPELNMLRLTNAPAILNEIAFVDNKKDIEDWNDDAELKKMGIALAEATAEWNKLKKKVAAPKEEAKQDATVKLSVLKKGASGAQVKTLQRILVSMGYNLGKGGSQKNGVDGDFGDKTDSAVKTYQKLHELPKNGIVDEKTWTKLLKG